MILKNKREGVWKEAFVA